MRRKSLNNNKKRPAGKLWNEARVDMSLFWGDDY